jgi:sterol desaturase/sphingolipid hydroxylase (fatty acid hydroxylase superfamily)
MTTTIASIVFFFGIAIWESFCPRKHQNASVLLRWLANISLGVTNGLLFGFLLPLSEIVRSDWIPQAAENAWRWMDNVPLAAFIVAFVLMDLFSYWMHRLFHAVPILWRMHKIHHADPDIDVSTSIRHHPLENLAGLLMTLFPAIVLGVPLSAIAAYGIAAGIVSSIAHGNIAIPAWLEHSAATLLVTTNVHRIHHSIVVAESNSNFGVVLSLWDRLFGTFASKSRLEHSRIRFGLQEFSNVRYCQLHRILGMPFIAKREQAAT